MENIHYKWYETYFIEPAQNIVRQAAIPLIGAGIAAGGWTAVAAGVAAGGIGLAAAGGAIYDSTKKKS